MAEKKVKHLTQTGINAGIPYCGAPRNIEDDFLHPPIAPFDQWLFKSELCPKCKEVYLGDDE